jgi:hypothetical protein
MLADWALVLPDEDDVVRVDFKKLEFVPASIGLPYADHSCSQANALTALIGPF